MRALLLLPVVAGVQVLETHQTLHNHVDYEGMKTTLKELAARTGDGKIEDDVILAVRAILAEVDTRLMDALQADLEQQQQAFDAAIQGIQNCDDTRNSWIQDVYPGVLQQETDSKKRHEDCRHQEIQTCTHRNTECNLQDDLVSGINRKMCDYPNFAGGDSEEVNLFMNCFSALICDKYEDYVAGRAQCRGLCSDLAAKTSECETLQRRSEDAFCNRNREVAFSCKSYRDCRHAAEGNFNTVMGSTRQVESLLQTQRSALECLQCYGRAILNHNRTLDHCDTPPDCKTLDRCPEIVYANPPEFIRCTDCSEMTTCGDSYRQHHYGAQAQDWLEGIISRKPDQCIPLVTSCTECNVPTKGSGDSECDFTSAGVVVAE